MPGQMEFKKKDEEVLSDGDIWADSDEDDYKPTIDEDEYYGVKHDGVEDSETAALRRQHAKKGYLDGLSTSKEDSLQEGFDKGYPMGAEIGIFVGKMIGQLQIIKALENIDDDIKKRANVLLVEARNELTIQKVLNRKYFDDDLNLPNEIHTLLQRWKSQCDDLFDDIKA
ncbi:hypothetical protein BN7_532 [Wickerhamomyces ciferrii]|uniref:Protein YAE1 n=1 Tax=Wickerhamomyces ciferrii (strain ATCC 14091 / BCRC 22168 / CBS 111 / JCM 3599 / NBRC 0793 / NRRL Y-1031 F-60-10) TaxID=1206466 RepID=K0K845_WICCF|nr:uncharacterized protein BN7_532 [Wickerhamomyces ciferrii]CCH40995.1 hypothetical protein BN7_532 [Wickerhamomyces ciferrii]